mgnify:CR=1 FL=1
MKRIGVIGSGIAGITTAYSLAKRGHKVTLIDARRYPAMATSYANAVSYTHLRAHETS